MYSAFGVDHGYEVSKADDKYGGHGPPSAGRRTLAYFGGPIHGAVAGKKGKKLRTIGNSYGGGVAGAVGGGVVGAGLGLATRKPGAAHVIRSAGTMGGAITGTQLGVNRNQRKGYYKKET